MYARTIYEDLYLFIYYSFINKLFTTFQLMLILAPEKKQIGYTIIFLMEIGLG